MKYNKLEYNSALFLSSISLFLGIGISKIINNVGSDSWISIIIGTLIGLLINYLYTKLPNHENKLFIYIYNVILLTINLLLITKLISSIYLNKTPNLIVILPIMLLLFYISNKGIQTIFKTSLLLLFIYLIIVLIPIISLTPNINIDEFKPLFTSNLTTIILNSIYYALISTTPFILFPKFKEYYNYKTYLLSSLLILLIFIIIIGNLGINLSKLYRYPEYMVFKEISLLGFIENIQNILSYLWLFCNFIFSSISTYNIKRISNNKILIITLIIITIILNIFLLNNYIYAEIITKYFIYILLFTIILYLLSKLIPQNKDWQSNIYLLLYVLIKGDF